MVYGVTHFLIIYNEYHSLKSSNILWNTHLPLHRARTQVRTSDAHMYETSKWTYCFLLRLWYHSRGSYFHCIRTHGLRIEWHVMGWTIQRRGRRWWESNCGQQTSVTLVTKTSICSRCSRGYAISSLSKSTSSSSRSEESEHSCQGRKSKDLWFWCFESLAVGRFWRWVRSWFKQ